MYVTGLKKEDKKLLIAVFPNPNGILHQPSRPLQHVVRKKA
jgi:hypothetical protein